MPELVLPSTAQHRSFVAAVGEDAGFFAAGPVPPADRLADPVEFARYLRRLDEDREDGTSRAEHLVPQTMLWWVEGAEFLARVGIRHRLNDRLRWYGGHIGYWTRPSARGRGHARAAFVASLPWAAGFGVDPALVTCDPGNVASRRIIESVVAERGGRYEAEVNGKRLYWVPTGRAESVPR